MILRATGTKVTDALQITYCLLTQALRTAAPSANLSLVGGVAISLKEGNTMLVIVNIALALIFASIYSSIWRRITGVDLDFAELIAIASAYIIVSVGIGRIIHFSLLTSLFAFGMGVWGVLKVVSSAINSQKG